MYHITFTFFAYIIKEATFYIIQLGYIFKAIRTNFAFYQIIHLYFSMLRIYLRKKKKKIDYIQ